MCSLGCRSGTATATATARATVAVAVTALKAGRQTIRRTCGQTDERRRGREGETDKQRPQACTIRRSQARQAVSRRRGNRLRNSFPRYNNHNSHKHARAHTSTHTHTQSHSNIEAQPQLKSFYCPQHKRAQRASVSESGRANTHTHTPPRIRKQKPAAQQQQLQQAQARRAHSI